MSYKYSTHKSGKCTTENDNLNNILTNNSKIYYISLSSFYSLPTRFYECNQTLMVHTLVCMGKDSGLIKCILNKCMNIQHSTLKPDDLNIDYMYINSIIFEGLNIPYKEIHF